jgi:hypothetical protein
MLIGVISITRGDRLAGCSHVRIGSTRDCYSRRVIHTQLNIFRTGFVGAETRRDDLTIGKFEDQGTEARIDAGGGRSNVGFNNAGQYAIPSLSRFDLKCVASPR